MLRLPHGGRLIQRLDPAGLEQVQVIVTITASTVSIALTNMTLIDWPDAFWSYPDLSGPRPPSRRP